MCIYYPLLLGHIRINKSTILRTTYQPKNFKEKIQKENFYFLFFSLYEVVFKPQFANVKKTNAP
jgi:hypothetical protein